MNVTDLVSVGLQSKQVVQALQAHQTRVTCVHWLPHNSSNGRMALASGSSEGEIMLWAVSKDGHDLADRPWLRDERHSGTVNQLCSLPGGAGNAATLCSVAADSRCIVWGVDAHETGSSTLKPLQQIALPCMQMSAALTCVPGHPDWCAPDSHDTCCTPQPVIKPVQGPATAGVPLNWPQPAIRALPAITAA
jgi:WD40 repeat protein